MKILIYSFMDMEKLCFQGLKDKYGVEFIFTSEEPKMENVKLAENADAVCIITTPVTSELIEAFYKKGVRYIATRTNGYDHIDIKAAEKIGMAVGNSEYSPDNVAEYTVMMMLMAERNIKTIINSYQNQDFSLRNVQGSTLKDLTVGIIGTGKIGMQVGRILKGFGCKIIAYSRSEKKEMKSLLTYVQLTELYEKSDIISLHMPATEKNFHMINKDVIKSMKDGAVIVNTARGNLLDTEALIEALESGKLGGAALDVLEDETQYYYREFKNRPIRNHNMAILRAMPNVILTPHTAFHTKQALDEMVKNAIDGCVKELSGQENPWKIV